MFSRKSCYFFVRPKKSFLEVCVFLSRPLKAPQVKRAEASSKTKFYNLIQVRHRDEVEAPITDWLQEAYDFGAAQAQKPAEEKKAPPKKKAARKKAAKKKVVKKKAAKKK
jgi:hypothetical protein